MTPPCPLLFPLSLRVAGRHASVAGAGEPVRGLAARGDGLPDGGKARTTRLKQRASNALSRMNPCALAFAAEQRQRLLPVHRRAGTIGDLGSAGASMRSNGAMSSAFTSTVMARTAPIARVVICDRFLRLLVPSCLTLDSAPTPSQGVTLAPLRLCLPLRSRRS